VNLREWKQCKLGDVLTLKRGYDLPQQRRIPGPFPIVSSSGVTDHHAEARVRGPGVITGRYGTLGEVFYVDGDFWPLNTSLYVQDFKGNDPRFVSYFLRLLNFATRNAAGAVPGVNRNHLHAIDVQVPPLDEQKEIAGILSRYETLIENCEQRIRVLGEMARALYSEWFVNFCYPGHENVPLVDSPLGPIPAGWRAEKLDTLKAKTRHAINGGPFGSKLGTKDYVPSGIPVIRGSNLSESGRFISEGFVFVTPEKASELSANLARPGDIVVTQRGTIGQIARIPDWLGFTEFVISQSQMKITVDPELLDPDFAFFFLASAEAIGRVKQLTMSAGVPHINLALLREFLVLVPTLSLQARFSAFARQSELAIERLIQQAIVLRKTRDLLLPRLLSGQLSVADKAA
jgi:type I restriction enzyme S subunit